MVKVIHYDDTYYCSGRVKLGIGNLKYGWGEKELRVEAKGVRRVGLLLPPSTRFLSQSKVRVFPRRVRRDFGG